MQFQVPGAVLAQIAEYDPAKPKLAKPSSKKRNPYGQVNDLFPTNIVPAETQDQWATSANSGGDKCYTHVTDTAHALLCLSPRGWTAFWHTKPGHTDHGKYVFGFSLAYKSAESTLKKFGEARMPHLNCCDLQTIAPYSEVKYGRVAMRKHTRLVTESDIAEWGMGGIETFGMVVDGWHRFNVFSSPSPQLLKGGVGKLAILT